MKHITFHGDDVPAAAFLMDRRRAPDRRAAWRGGRRDSDWIRRPPGAWPRATVEEPQPAWWRQALASLQVW